MADRVESLVDNSPKDGFWLFGYGSLIWKPPPHFDRRVPGYIEGYVRRFWQASEDHRGTPDAPGRVVTLIERSFYLSLIIPENSRSPPPLPLHVWGAAYHIPIQHAEEVQAYLDIREVNGYSIQYTFFQPADSRIAPIEKCMVYIGLPSNPQFLGRQDPDELARHIWKSEGPSGGNPEYLFMLEEALTGLGEGAGDEHVEDLARKVRSLLKDTGEDSAEGNLSGSAKHDKVNGLESGTSSHEQEETDPC